MEIRNIFLLKLCYEYFVPTELILMDMFFITEIPSLPGLRQESNTGKRKRIRQISAVGTKSIPMECQTQTLLGYLW
jgi:hypothetical protein